MTFPARGGGRGAPAVDYVGGRIQRMQAVDNNFFHVTFPT